MDADSSAAISVQDRELMRRLTAALFFIVLLTAGFSYLWELFSNKFHDITGQATWIWAPHRISRNTPVVFFAARDFDLPKHRAWTRIKILGDPEYTLYFNGHQIGGRRVGDALHLDTYEVSKLAHDGKNRLLIAVRSTNGVGGLIASIDIAPEIENIVVTGSDWKIFPVWNSELPVRDVGSSVTPMVLGEPPAGRWNYLAQRSAELSAPPSTVIQPSRSWSYRATIPTIKIRSGVAVAVPEAARATAYDFGPTAGHVRLVLNRPYSVPPVVRVRLANAEQELSSVEADIRSFVFGAGETMVLDPEVHHFRYVVVYGGRARAEVVK
jgi:hypothetical protein